MNPNFAKGACPICGEMADWRINKNGIVYSYCPNSHLIKLGRKDSTAVKDAISAGNREYKTTKIYLKGINNDRTEQSTGTNQPTNAGNVNYGRPNGKPATIGTNATNSPANDDSDFLGDII